MWHLIIGLILFGLAFVFFFDMFVEDFFEGRTGRALTWLGFAIISGSNLLRIIG